MKLGVMTTALRELAQRTVCKGAALREEPAPKAALSPWVMDRLGGRRLVRATCEPDDINQTDLRLTYDGDDGSLYGLIVRQLTHEQVMQWLDALEIAGLDSVSISGARDLLKNHKDDGRFVEIAGGPIKTADGARSFTIHGSKDSWSLYGDIVK